MAECPLPKPNTRVRFPSPAPKEEGDSTRNPPLLLESVTGFEKLCARIACPWRICKANLRLDCKIEAWFRFPSIFDSFNFLFFLSEKLRQLCEYDGGKHKGTSAKFAWREGIARNDPSAKGGKNALKTHR